MCKIRYSINKATIPQINSHLTKCNDYFIPPLTEYSNIKLYSEKIFNRAMKFEAWSQNELIGLIAIYLNNLERNIGYITNVSVCREYMGNGVATRLLMDCIKFAKFIGINSIELEVNEYNVKAIKFYQKFGFKNKEYKKRGILMYMTLNQNV